MNNLITRQITSAAMIILPIAVSMILRLEVWHSTAILCVMAVVAYILKRRWCYRLLIVGAVLCYASILNPNHADLPREGSILLHIERRNRATLEGFRDESGWHNCREMVYYRQDTLLDLRRGDYVVANARILPLDKSYYVTLESQSVEHIERGSDIAIAQRIKEYCSARIDRLGLTPSATKMVKAMLLGMRSEVERERYEEYQHSGAAHLLAVSGLHVAIIYLIVGQMLRLLHVFRNGYRFLPFVSVAIIWLYASVVGLSPSVQRAAIIFTLYHLLRITGRGGVTIGIIALAAAGMVLFEPYMIFDVGFLLSVSAVCAIVLWVQPLSKIIKTSLYEMNLWRVARRLINFIVSALVVGAACTLATLPLVASTFGYFAPFGMLLNPLLMITTYLIILISLVWVLFGVPIVISPFRELLDSLVALQDGAVSRVANSVLGAYEVEMSGWVAMLIYLIFIVGTIMLHRYLNTRTKDPVKRLKHVKYPELDL